MEEGCAAGEVFGAGVVAFAGCLDGEVGEPIDGVVLGFFGGTSLTGIKSLSFCIFRQVFDLAELLYLAVQWFVCSGNLERSEGLCSSGVLNRWLIRWLAKG